MDKPWFSNEVCGGSGLPVSMVTDETVMYGEILVLKCDECLNCVPLADLAKADPAMLRAWREAGDGIKLCPACAEGVEF